MLLKIRSLLEYEYLKKNNKTYVDFDTSIDCVLIDLEKQDISISGKDNLNIEFHYAEYELNKMSNESFTKFYFYSGTSTLGITVNAK